MAPIPLQPLMQVLLSCFHAEKCPEGRDWIFTNGGLNLGCLVLCFPCGLYTLPLFLASAND